MSARCCAGGYNVQMRFNGNPVAALTIELTGTVADDDVFVLAHASASAAILAEAFDAQGYRLRHARVSV